MQRNDLLAGALAGLFSLTLAAGAQDPATAAAEREDREANYRRMSVQVESFEATLHSYQKTIAKLVTEVHSLREEVDALKARNDSAATQESIKRLQERLQDKIEEVDKKRQADNELVRKNVAASMASLLKDLNKTLVPNKEPAPPPKDPPEKIKPAGEANKMYKIKDGDTLNRIVKELGAQGYKVTQKQVMDANPTVNWTKLKIGQTVLIPPPLGTPPNP